MKLENSAGAGSANARGDSSAANSNSENNLMKELNPEEINISFTSDFLVKSITLKIHSAFDKEQVIDLNCFHKQIKNENGLALRINSIDKKAYLSKEDFSLSLSMKSFIVETEKNKISILKKEKLCERVFLFCN